MTDLRLTLDLTRLPDLEHLSEGPLPGRGQLPEPVPTLAFVRMLFALESFEFHLGPRSVPLCACTGTSVSKMDGRQVVSHQIASSRPVCEATLSGDIFPVPTEARPQVSLLVEMELRKIGPPMHVGKRGPPGRHAPPPGAPMPRCASRSSMPGPAWWRTPGPSTAPSPAAVGPGRSCRGLDPLTTRFGRLPRLRRA